MVWTLKMKNQVDMVRRDDEVFLQQQISEKKKSAFLLWCLALKQQFPNFLLLETVKRCAHCILLQRPMGVFSALCDPQQDFCRSLIVHRMTLSWPVWSNISRVSLTIKRRTVSTRPVLYTRGLLARWPGKEGRGHTEKALSASNSAISDSLTPKSHP